MRMTVRCTLGGALLRQGEREAEDGTAEQRGLCRREEEGVVYDREDGAGKSPLLVLVARAKYHEETFFEW